MEIKELLQTKAYVKSGMTFGTPQEYVGEFIEEADKLEGKVTVRTSGKTENANEDQSLNTAFSRVLVEAKLGDEMDGLHGKVGIVYALDTQKPVIKAYYGNEVSACTNLCVFRAEDLFVGDLQSPDVLEKFHDNYIEFLQTYFERFEQYNKICLQLRESAILSNQVNELIGGLLRYAISPIGKYIGTTPVVGAANELFTNSSRYFVGKNDTTKWNIYSAVTEHLKKADIKDQASKTLLLSNFFLKNAA